MGSKLAWLTGMLVLCGAAAAETRWDLPSGYPPSDFHTENLMQLAADVDRGSGGQLKITVYPNATLFKSPEIKRAVQGGQAPIGEILLTNHADEWAIFGADGIPFLADGYDSAMKLYRAQRPLLERKFAEQGMMLLYAVPWPPQGMYSRTPIASAGDGGNCGHHQCRRGWRWRIQASVWRALVDNGDERKPCK